MLQKYLSKLAIIQATGILSENRREYQNVVVPLLDLKFYVTTINLGIKSYNNDVISRISNWPICKNSLNLVKSGNEGKVKKTHRRCLNILNIS